ncbi:MAG: hypothetical protein HY558_03060 [Euryarchaeota archaeon]|nr:hypothetical protein [Euryarchaeota archaeon]
MQAKESPAGFTPQAQLATPMGGQNRLEEAIEVYRSRGGLVTAARIAGVSVQRMMELLFQRAVEEQNARRRSRPA